MKTAFYALMGCASLLFFSCNKENDLIPENAGLKSDVAENVTALDLSIADAVNWMSFLPDSMSVDRLSIPGTHDSGAQYEPVSGTAKTQDLSIADQLLAGVRFLDIRCRHYQDAFVIHHGSVYQHLNFDDVLNACKQFLQAHPSETIVMSVKEEYDAAENTLTFQEEFDQYVQQDPGVWYLASGIPTLGAARGKIVLFRRFSYPTAKGIDASHNWGDKATFTIDNGTYTVQVQDEYEVSDNNAKYSAITNLFQQALQNNAEQQQLFVNFTSGYQNILWVIPNIPNVSNVINPKVADYFTNAQSGRYGIIPMDFITGDIAWKIIQTNF